MSTLVHGLGSDMHIYILGELCIMTMRFLESPTECDRPSFRDKPKFLW